MMTPQEIRQLRKRCVEIVAVGFLSCLLNGCKSKPAEQATATQATPALGASDQQRAAATGAVLQSPIEAVRDGYLAYNRTTTIGKALVGTYKNGTWKSFETEKGTTVVEFEASVPFGQAMNSPIACTLSSSCLALLKKLSDFCDSPDGWDQATKDYRKNYDEIWAKVLEARKVPNNDSEASNLQAQAMNLPKPENSCVQNSYKQHSNDPIAIVVQFTVNHDGTFQYHSNNMGLSQGELFSVIYN